MRFLYYFLIGFILSASLLKAQGNESAVQKLLNEQETAWNKNDMRAFCKDFTDDAVLINFLGMYWEGRENILAEFAKINDCCIKPTSVKFELLSAKEIAPTVLIAYVKETLTAKEDYAVPGKTVPKGSVDLKIITLVLVKENAAWKFKTGHLTLIVPVPADEN